MILAPQNLAVRVLALQNLSSWQEVIFVLFCTMDFVKICNEIDIFCKEMQLYSPCISHTNMKTLTF